MHFLYGRSGQSARNITGLPLNTIRFDYSFMGGGHGGPTCDSCFLYRHFKNNLVQIVEVHRNIIEIDIY